MKFVLLVYQGSTPLPGSDRWQALSEAEQKQIYVHYAELNKTEGITAGLPLGLPDAARTVQVRDGKTHVKNGTYLPEGAAAATRQTTAIATIPVSHGPTLANRIINSIAASEQCQNQRVFRRCQMDLS